MRLQRVRSIALLLTTALSMAQTPPPATAPHPKFTIGKDTTLIDGPLNPDGTINYVAAINKILSEGVTNENNAAIPLLSIKIVPLIPVTPGVSLEKQADAVLAELHASPPADRPSFQTFEAYMAKKENPDNPALADQEKYSQILDDCQSHPWKSANHPEVADWLKQSDAALRTAEQAARMRHYFVPFVSSSDPPKTTDALPPLANVSSIYRHAFVARAMLVAGEGDLPGALGHLQAMRRMARLLDQEHVFIFHLIGMAVEFDALRGYAALANGIKPGNGDLDHIRKEINAFEPLLESDPKREQIELMTAARCDDADHTWRPTTAAKTPVVLGSHRIRRYRPRKSSKRQLGCRAA